MKLMKLFKKARLGKRRKGMVSDADTEMSAPRQRPVVMRTTPMPDVPPIARPESSSTRHHDIRRQALAARPTRSVPASGATPHQPTVVRSSRQPFVSSQTSAAGLPVKPRPKKPAVFHDIMPPRGAQCSRNSSALPKPSKPHSPKQTLSPSRASLIKPAIPPPSPAKRPLNKLSSVKAQPVKPLSSHPPLTKPPFSSQALNPTRPLNPAAVAPYTNMSTPAKRPLSQPHQLPTQPTLPPQPKELTHPQTTAHSRTHIAVPSRRPQLTHRPPHIRAMDMVHK